MIFPQIPCCSTLFRVIHHALWKLQKCQGGLISLLPWGFSHHFSTHSITLYHGVVPCALVQIFASLLFRQHRACAHSFPPNFPKRDSGSGHSLTLLQSSSLQHRHVQRFLDHHHDVKQYPVPLQHIFRLLVVYWRCTFCPQSHWRPPNNRAIGPIAALEQRATTLRQRTDKAAVVAREAVADAFDINNAHAAIVSQHRKMFLATAFGINPNGTPITNPSLGSTKKIEDIQVRQVRQTVQLYH